MKRPIGLILSAILLSLAALILLLLGALMVFTGTYANHQPAIAASPRFIIYFTLALSIVYAALAVWAILTVIGILRLRPWARYSILVIGGGVAALGILGVFGIFISRLMLPSLQAQQPTLDPHILSLVFLLMAAVELLIAAVGVWWLVYFNLHSVRELFANPLTLMPTVSGPGGRFSNTPTAIKIIAGVLMFSALCCLFCALLPFPAFILGFILPIPATHILYLCFAALAGWMGYGLLRLKESARLATIALQIFGCINVSLALLPWYQARLRLYTEQITSYITIPGQPHASLSYTTTLMTFPLIFGILIYGLVLWLLHRHRAVFKTPVPPPPMLEA